MSKPEGEQIEKGLSLVGTTFVIDLFPLQSYSKFITVTPQWARWHLKSPACRLFNQKFVQKQIKGNIKAPRHWPLWGKITSDRWIPRTKGQRCEKCLHLMTSSWIEIEHPMMVSSSTRSPNDLHNSTSTQNGKISSSCNGHLGPPFLTSITFNWKSNHTLYKV